MMPMQSYIARLRHVFDENQVAFQLTEMGKIDAGGGGTIAYILANFGMEVIDGGVAVLSMHSPWELSSKADVYEAYRGYCAFLKRYEIKDRVRRYFVRGIFFLCDGICWNCAKCIVFLRDSRQYIC